MKILIFTQIVDIEHPILGFFHEWIIEFAKYCSHIHVVCLYEGIHKLPSNVTVHSLGKEKGVGRFVYLHRFFLYIWKLRNEYDSVFVHMNQIYVILGGLLWRATGKNVCLWYAHGSVSFSLRVALMLVHSVVTSTKEGFRLQSKKVHVVGQGINTIRFNNENQDLGNSGVVRIIYVGRIAQIKKCEILIKALYSLVSEGVDTNVTFVGDCQENPKYYNILMDLVEKYQLKDVVKFIGAVKNEQLPSYIRYVDIFANTSTTGSLDKAGLEALACGVPVITCNEAYRDLFGPYAERLMYENDNPKILAKKILALIRSFDRENVSLYLKGRVLKEHSIETLIPKILGILNSK